MTKGWIFDYGGTIDTDGCHWGKKIWHAYEALQVKVGEDAYREAYVNAERVISSAHLVKPDFTFEKTLRLKLRLQLEYLCTQGHWDADSEQFERIHAEMTDLLYAQTKSTVAQNRLVIDAIGRHFPLVVVSNFYGNLQTVLREFQLDSLFEAVVESAQVRIRKPDPRLFSLGIKALKMNPEEVVVIGDSFYKDIEPAKRLGCKTVWLKGEGWTSVDYDTTFPTYTIDTLSQILRLPL